MNFVDGKRGETGVSDWLFLFILFIFAARIRSMSSLQNSGNMHREPSLPKIHSDICPLQSKNAEELNVRKEFHSPRIHSISPLLNLRKRFQRKRHPCTPPEYVLRPIVQRLYENSDSRSRPPSNRLIVAYLDSQYGIKISCKVFINPNVFYASGRLWKGA